MSETDFRFITLFRDFKNNFRALPLALVFSEIEIVIQNQPNGSLVRNDFYQFHLAMMDVFVTIGKLITEFVGTAFNFF